MQGNRHFIIAYYFNTLPKFIVLVFACGIGYGVSLAVGFLLVMQVILIEKNTRNTVHEVVRLAKSQVLSPLIIVTTSCYLLKITLGRYFGSELLSLSPNQYIV